MSKTALIYHPDYLKHDAGELHPERQERLIATMKYFQEKGLLEKIEILTPEPATEEDLLRVHIPEQVNFIRELSRKGGGRIDADTLAQKNTYEIAKLAAGGDILAGKAVMGGKARNSFALVRPPGHHATRNQSMGFCYFNNVAIAIRYLQEKFLIRKTFLLDWDIHAFNGTSEIFYEDPTVLNVSLHQDPRTLYPGAGFINEIGKGKGEGYTVNIPLEPGSGNSDYLYLMKKFICPLVDSFQPEMIVISAGQDSHKDELMSQLNLTEEGYYEMTRIMVKKAEEYCQGKLWVELEGGYNSESFKRSNYEIMKGLLGERKKMVFPKEVMKSTRETSHSLRRIFKKYHSLG